MIALQTSENPVASIVIPTHDNLQMLAECLDAIATTIDAANVPYEVIVLFQAMDPASVRSFLKSVSGLCALQAPLNLGFGAANNFAARHAKGRYLLLLNDDTVPQNGWLEALVATAEADPTIGAVGSRLLYTDGRLQEAGAILWSDATTSCPGRGVPTGSLAYTYVREVDFTSANGMLVRRDSFERVGGFDELFYPGYYEDADLCLAIRHRLNQKILYDPRSTIVHVESATMMRDPEFRSFLFRRHKAALRAKWREELDAHYDAPGPDSPAAIERTILRRRGAPARVLVIDDRVPEQGMGSGFARARDVLEELHDARFATALFRSNERVTVTENALADLGVDLVEGDLSRHLHRPEKSYDVVIVSRPHNYNTYARTIRTRLPAARLIYDAEALYHKRLLIQAALAKGSAVGDRFAAEAAAMEQIEKEIVRSADRVVVISPEERSWVESVDGHGAIDFMRPLLAGISMTPANLDRRSDAVFVAAWLADEGSPNVDALGWFVERVMPHLTQALPGFRLLVTGKNPPLSVQLLESKHVVFTGFLDSVERLYANARVAIAPIRAGAGVKNKTMEALQYGVPVVATGVGAEGLELEDGRGIDITDDPGEFAARVLALLTRADVWLERRAELERTVAQWKREQTFWPGIIARALAAGTPPQQHPSEGGGDFLAALVAHAAELEREALEAQATLAEYGADAERVAGLAQRLDAARSAIAVQQRQAASPDDLLTAVDAFACELELLLLDQHDLAMELQHRIDGPSAVG